MICFLMVLSELVDVTCHLLFQAILSARRVYKQGVVSSSGITLYGLNFVFYLRVIHYCSKDDRDFDF